MRSHPPPPAPRASCRLAATALALLLSQVAAHAAPAFQDEVRRGAHARTTHSAAAAHHDGFQRRGSAHDAPAPLGGASARDEHAMRRQLRAASAPQPPLYVELAGSAARAATAGGAGATPPLQQQRTQLVEAALTDGFHAAAARHLATAASDSTAAALLLVSPGGGVTHAPLRDWFMSTWDVASGERTPEEAAALESLFAEFKRRNGLGGLADGALVSRDFCRSWGVRAFFEDEAPGLAAARAAGQAAVAAAAQQSELTAR